MDAIILAGGLGTRLRKVLPDIPKPLAPVNGRPFLDALLEYLDCSENIGKVVLATGHLAEAIMDRYADAQYHFPIVFSREESLLGTGGAIKYALPLTSGDDVIVINGDTYADVDIRALLKFHREKNGAATIAVARACLKTLPYLRGVCSACEALVSTSMCCKHISVSDSASRRRTPAARFGNPGFETSSRKKESARYGAVAFDDAHKIYSFDEKSGSSEFVNAGTLIFRRSMFDFVSEAEVCSLEKDLIPQWLAHGVYAYVHQDGFLDIGTPESYAEAGGYINARKKR